MKKTDTKRLVMTTFLVVIVVVLQYMGSFIHLGTFSVSLVLVPIVIGAALYGPGCGALLGFVFGVVVLISGDAARFLVVNAIGTVITVLAKGTLSGFAAGLVFKALHGKNETAAVALAAITAPVVNTGIFLIGCLLFFLETITMWAGGTNVGVYMITGFVGLNFVVEVAINMILSPVILRLLKLSKQF